MSASAYQARLSDGTPLYLRPLRPSDAALLRAGYEQLSERSRAQRFLGAAPGRLDGKTLEYLTAVDQADHLAWAAFAGPAGRRQGAGVARCLRLEGEPEVAEMAVTVADVWQRRGVGGLLLAALARAAHEQDIRRFRAWTAPDNLSVLRTFRALGVTPTLEAPGVLRLEVELPAILARFQLDPAAATGRRG